MDKKPKKKLMFGMKETLVHLTPQQMGHVQGANGEALQESGCYRYTCNYTI